MLLFGRNIRYKIKIIQKIIVEKVNFSLIFICLNKIILYLFIRFIFYILNIYKLLKENYVKLANGKHEETNTTYV